MDYVFALVSKTNNSNCKIIRNIHIILLKYFADILCMSVFEMRYSGLVLMILIGWSSTYLSPEPNINNWQVKLLQDDNYQKDER